MRLGRHENRFLLFGGRDESSAALIQGSTLAGVLLDEAALMPRSFVEQAIARCSVPGSRLWFNCNPENPQHWFYREWILKAGERRALYLHFTMEDNPALTPRIRARYRSAYSGVFYRRFVLGSGQPPRGGCTTFLTRSATVSQSRRGSFGSGGSLWTTARPIRPPSPVGAAGGHLVPDGGVFTMTPAGRADSEIARAEYVRELKRLAGERRIERVIVDPSAASFIQALRREGFRVIRANNDVSDGIRVTADLLKRRQIVICDTCRDCLREMETYCWDTGGQRDAPRKEQDHAMDDMRYFAMDAAAETGGGFAATWVERRL